MEDFGSAMEIGSGLKPDHNNIEVNYLCDVDPTELLLQHVTRDFSGEFSCSASNAAGEGPESEPVLLNVEYAPENIEISTTFLSIREHEVIDPIYYSGEGVPEPVVLWKFDEKAVTNENTLDFSDLLIREHG